LQLPPHVGENHDAGGNCTQVRFHERAVNLNRV
jgi:hypothetical protein